MDEQLLARLDALDAKLDYVVERQEYTEELIREMTPVVREAMGSIAVKMGEWEERGWFRMANEGANLLDKVAEAYGPDDIHELSESVVAILETVRNVTQPDVLAFANEATEVLHHADEVEPVGPFKMAQVAMADDDVKHGLAMALEVLRNLGRVRQARDAVPRQPRATRPPKPAASEAKRSSFGRAAPKPKVGNAPMPAPQVAAPVEWEGRHFTPEGFLLDSTAWDEELAVKMAAGLGIQLTEDHWTLIRWIRTDYAAHGASPNVRRMASGSGLGTKALYALFPKTPGKSAAMIAGVPKPVGCV